MKTKVIGFCTECGGKVETEDHSQDPPDRPGYDKFLICENCGEVSPDMVMGEYETDQVYFDGEGPVEMTVDGKDFYFTGASAGNHGCSLFYEGNLVVSMSKLGDPRAVHEVKELLNEIPSLRRDHHGEPKDN